MSDWLSLENISILYNATGERAYDLVPLRLYLVFFNEVLLGLGGTKVVSYGRSHGGKVIANLHGSIDTYILSMQFGDVEASDCCLSINFANMWISL